MSEKRWAEVLGELDDSSLHGTPKLFAVDEKILLLELARRCGRGSGCVEAKGVVQINGDYRAPPTYGITRPIGNVLVLLTSKSILCCRSCTLLNGAMKFQEQLNYEISNILIGNSDYLVSYCCMDGA